MDSSTLAGKRRLVGLLALACFGAAALMWLAGAQAATNPVVGSLPRVGIVLATLWYALPKEGENVVWSRALTPLIGVVVALAVLRRAAWWLLPGALVVAVALVVLRPRGTKGAKPRR